jgi:uncharacterized protein
VRVPTNLQRWDRVTFLHWPYPPALVQRHLPPGLVVDVPDGAAWVGVTPFVMRGLRFPLTPALPPWSRFLEVNVRTYVRHPASGTDGLWFFTLLAPRAAVVAGLRVVGLPYSLAGGDARGDAAGTAYRAASRHHGSLRCEVRPGAALTRPTGWLDAVTGRWNAYTRRAGRLWRIPVEHDPWPLHDAAADVRTDVLERAGLPAPDREPIVTWSPGVDVRIGVPRPLPAATAR